MQEIVDDFFSSKGVHLLISVNDDSGTPIHPDEWTLYQKNSLWNCLMKFGNIMNQKVKLLPVDYKTS